MFIRMILYAIIQPQSSSIDGSLLSIHAHLKVSQRFYNWSPVPRTFIETAMISFNDQDRTINGIRGKMADEVADFDEYALRRMLYNASRADKLEREKILVYRDESEASLFAGDKKKAVVHRVVWRPQVQLLNDSIRDCVRIQMQKLKLETDLDLYKRLREDPTTIKCAESLYEDRLAGKWHKAGEIVLELRPFSRKTVPTDGINCPQYKYSAGTAVSGNPIMLSISSGYIIGDLETPEKDTLYYPSKSNFLAIDFLVRNGNQYYGLQTTVGKSYGISSALLKTFKKFESGHTYHHIFVVDEDMDFSVPCPRNSPWKGEFPFSVSVAVVPFEDD